ncbi:MAG: aminotransferase class III-fold pyridoxal phosphate-dependent enzyme [Planctomycetota bacterium]
MKFAFLVHPLTEETQRALSLDRGLKEAVSKDFVSWVQHLHQSMARVMDASGHPPAPEVRVVDEFSDLVSALGHSTHGRLYEIPMDAFAILDDPVRAVEHILDAVNIAADWGARIVGLGSMTGIVGGQGEYVAERAPIPVTTGNSLTVYAAVENLLAACRATGLEVAESRLAVLGIPGSIATAAARMLAPRCKSVVLVGRSRGKRAIQLADELGADYSTDIPSALERANLVFSATSSGQCIDQRCLAPGTIVADVAVPADVCGTTAERSDVLLLTGGLSRVPETMPLSSDFMWFHRGMIPSCLAETMVLALEDHTECYSLGRNLSVDRVREIGRTAEAHGFRFDQLFSFGLRLEDSTLVEFRKHLARQPKARRGGSASKSQSSPTPPALTSTTVSNGRAAPTPAELARGAAERWRRYANPVLMSISGQGFIKVFERGEGTRLSDSEGKSYLDFVAGFGSVNLGHNHPRVVEALRTALAESAPGFAPAAVNPYAAALADELVTIAPSGLEMVFFSNSGTESVEAALKLARAATGRGDFLYCEGSYHGKSLGSLSVTGNSTYQRPFQPLLPGCRAIPYGDIEALRRALGAQRYAAFIVEPMQGEGGMIVPPAGYLKEVERCCRESGTLLIVDEVQTGLGRTGAMFAVDHCGVEPDLLTLAKSLSGGLVPIGATLARRDLWMRAYGTLQTFALHTSTFSGGSLASAAGLATVRELRDGDVIANAAAQGERLLKGLRAICGESNIVRDVRGMGLLIGVEMKPLPQLMQAHWKATVSGGASGYLVPNLDAYLASMPALYVMSTLLDEYGIYTQVTRSNPLVLRIQPPLVISAAEVDFFLDSMGACCREADFCGRMFETMVAKSGSGQIDARGGLIPPELTSKSKTAAR